MPWPTKSNQAKAWAYQLDKLQVSKLQQELSELNNAALEGVLAKARVIGCTTTGAAMQQTLLTGPRVAPGWVAWRAFHTRAQHSALQSALTAQQGA